MLVIDLVVGDFVPKLPLGNRQNLRTLGHIAALLAEHFFDVLLLEFRPGRAQRQFRQIVLPAQMRKEELACPLFSQFGNGYCFYRLFQQAYSFPQSRWRPAII